MIKQVLMDKFNKNITSSVMRSANDVLRNDLIKDVTNTLDKDTITIKSTVISESLLSEYSCKIIFDIKTMDIIGTYCSCADYEKNEFKKVNLQFLQVKELMFLILRCRGKNINK